MKTLKNSSKEDQNSLIPGLYENRIASCSSLFGVMASSKYKKWNLGKHLNNFIGFFFKWSGCQKTCRVHNEEKSKKSLILAINATYTAYYQLDYFSILIPLCLDNKSIDVHVFKKDLWIIFFTLPLTLASCWCKILCQIVYIFTACQPLDGKFGRLPKRCLKFGSPLFMLLLFVMADWMLLPLLDLIFSREKTKAIMHHHRTLHHESYPKLQKPKISNK